MILVTGCTGYIGFHICEILESKRIPYFGIDDFSRSHSKNIINKKRFLKTNINSKIISSLISNKRIHTVIHAAAFSFPPESEKNQKIYFENNIEKTKTFINLCVKKKLKNLFSYQVLMYIILNSIMLRQYLKVKKISLQTIMVRRNL